MGKRFLAVAENNSSLCVLRTTCPLEAIIAPNRGREGRRRVEVENDENILADKSLKNSKQ